jgi:hypothetical protein
VLGFLKARRFRGHGVVAHGQKGHGVLAGRVGFACEDNGVLIGIGDRDGGIWHHRTGGIADCAADRAGDSLCMESGKGKRENDGYAGSEF